MYMLHLQLVPFVTITSRVREPPVSAHLSVSLRPFHIISNSFATRLFGTALHRVCDLHWKRSRMRRSNTSVQTVLVRLNKILRYEILLRLWHARFCTAEYLTISDCTYIAPSGS